MPQLETGKISCVRLPCYGRLSPRQRIDNAGARIKFPADLSARTKLNIGLSIFTEIGFLAGDFRFDKFKNLHGLG